MGLAIGMVMFGTLSFLPLFVQVVNQSSATQAGRILTPMMLAMVVVSPIAARLILVVGYRVLSVAGFGFALVGTFLLTRLDTEHDASSRPASPWCSSGSAWASVFLVDDPGLAELGRPPAHGRSPPAS